MKATTRRKAKPVPAATPPVKALDIDLGGGSPLREAAARAAAVVAAVLVCLTLIWVGLNGLNVEWGGPW